MTTNLQEPSAEQIVDKAVSLICDIGFNYLTEPWKTRVFSYITQALQTATETKDARIVELEAKLAMTVEALEYARKHDPIGEWIDAGGGDPDKTSHCGLVAHKAHAALQAAAPEIQAYKANLWREVVEECITYLAEEEFTEGSLALQALIQPKAKEG